MNTGQEQRWVSRAAVLLLLLLACRLSLALFAYPTLVSAYPEWAWANNDGYDRIAMNWARTGVFSLNPGVPTAQRMPLYPFLNAAAFRGAGETYPAWVRFGQALLSVWTGGLLYRMGRAWAGPKTGEWMLLLFLAHPHINHFVIRCATETLFIFLTTGWLFHLFRYRETARTRALIFSGLYLGLAFLTRPSLGFLPVILYPWAAVSAWRRSRSWKKAVLDVAYAGLLATALIAPWLWRNYQYTGQFPVFQTWVGRPLYQGAYISEHVGVFLRGDVTLTELDERALYEVSHRTHLDLGPLRGESLHPVRAEWEADRYARTLALARWRQTPGASAGRWARNLFLAPVLQMTRRSTALLFLWNMPLLILGVWGGIHAMCRCPERRAAAVPWTVAFLYFWAIHAWAWPQARYLLPAFVPFLLFAAERISFVLGRNPVTSHRSAE